MSGWKRTQGKGKPAGKRPIWNQLKAGARKHFSKLWAMSATAWIAYAYVEKGSLDDSAMALHSLTAATAETIRAQQEALCNSKTGNLQSIIDLLKQENSLRSLQQADELESIKRDLDKQPKSSGSPFVVDFSPPQTQLIMTLEQIIASRQTYFTPAANVEAANVRAVLDAMLVTELYTSRKAGGELIDWNLSPLISPAADPLDSLREAWLDPNRIVNPDDELKKG